MLPLEQIHPMLVHFPIVLVIGLAAFDAVATAMGTSVTGRTANGNVSTALAVLAAGAAAATYAAGGMALDIAEAGGFSSRIAELHEMLGSLVAGSLAVWAMVRAWLWWRDRRFTGAAAAVMPLVAGGCAALVVATAWYGGQLVFDLGVNVTRRAAEVQQAPAMSVAERDRLNPFWLAPQDQAARRRRVARDEPAPKPAVAR